MNQDRFVEWYVTCRFNFSVHDTVNCKQSSCEADTRWKIVYIQQKQERAQHGPLRHIGCNIYSCESRALEYDLLIPVGYEMPDPIKEFTMYPEEVKV